MTGPPPNIGAELSQARRRSLLESKQHGVLSLGADNRGYGLPVAFRFDASNNRIVLGLVALPESKKREFVEVTEEATLTVYNFSDVDVWVSVIVTGTVHPIDATELSSDLLTLFFTGPEHDGDEAADGFHDLTEYDRDLYELRISDISGRYSGRGLSE